MTDDQEFVELGGQIKLCGFTEVDGGSMVVLKKIIGNYARKISDNSKDFQGLQVTLKKLHESGGHPKFEVIAKAVNAGHAHSAEVVDRNIFVAVDGALRKVLHMFHK